MALDISTIKGTNAHDGRITNLFLKLLGLCISRFGAHPVTGIMWVNHHRLFTNLRKSDNRYWF